MIVLQFVAFALGTILIRVLHTARRKLTGEDKYFSFSDFLLDEKHVRTRGFVYMALAPFLGGLVLGLWPAVDPIVAVAAGFAAAFLGVWPVFKFPYHLLEEHLLPYWGKLKFLYILFLGFSTALAYLGCVAAREIAPIMLRFGESNAWESFLNNIAANAVYEVLRATIIGILVLSGLYVSRERQLIGAQIEKQREKEWEEELAEHRRQNQNEGIETDLGE
jgi:hypothetical protein